MEERKKIYTIMVFEKLEKSKLGWPEMGDTWVPGWYSEFTDAEASVLCNNLDIHEAVYDFAMIEQVEEGLHGISKNRWLYKYNPEKKGYEKIEEPEFLKHVAGFTIG